jgi:hypothetical protein
LGDEYRPLALQDAATVDRVSAEVHIEQKFGVAALPQFARTKQTGK